MLADLFLQDLDCPYRYPIGKSIVDYHLTALSLGPSTGLGSVPRSLLGAAKSLETKRSLGPGISGIHPIPSDSWICSITPKLRSASLDGYGSPRHLDRGNLFRAVSL